MPLVGGLFAYVEGVLSAALAGTLAFELAVVFLSAWPSRSPPPARGVWQHHDPQNIKKWLKVLEAKVAQVLTDDRQPTAFIRIVRLIPLQMCGAEQVRAKRFYFAACALDVRPA